MSTFDAVMGQIKGELSKLQKICVSIEVSRLHEILPHLPWAEVGMLQKANPRTPRLHIMLPQWVEESIGALGAREQ